MAQALDSILNFFTGLGQFILNVVDGFIQLVQMIPKALAFIGTAFGTLPSVIAAFALAMITVSVVYLIIGR